MKRFLTACIATCVGLFILLPAAAMVFAIASPAWAASTWKLSPDQSGDWWTSGNWTGGIPFSGDTAYICNGGTATITSSSGCNTLLLGTTAGSGTVLMSAGTFGAIGEEIGYSGVGHFVQTGGTNSKGSLSSTLILGYNTASSGTYDLSGTGVLAPSDEYVGLYGTGTILQSGGTNTVNMLRLGLYSGSTGNYRLSGTGQLSTGEQRVGESGAGDFGQSGGVNTATTLYLGYYAGASGTYTLSDTGQLVAGGQYVGNYTPMSSTSVASGTGTFLQSGGTDTTSRIGIGSTGVYRLTGGVLNLANGGVDNQGTWVVDLSSGTATINMSSAFVDLSNATLTSTQGLAINADAHSLLIVPKGFDTAHSLAGYSNAGILHQTGTTLTISAGQSIIGVGSINDQVVCQGTISAVGTGPDQGVVVSPTYVNLNNGLVLSGAGLVTLGSGALTVNDATSQITAGASFGTTQYVGNGGTGTFSHSGGSNSVTNIYLGYNGADKGAYSLSGTAQLSASTQYVGYSGTGSFVQTGGSNSVTNSTSPFPPIIFFPLDTIIFPITNSSALYLGYNTSGSGSYQLSGNGYLSAATQYVGYSGKGFFSQLGGTNSASGGLSLGCNTGGAGTYNFGGGSLNTSSLTVGGSGTGVFSQSGGNLLASSEYIGFSGAGTFTQSSGVNSINGVLSIGCNSGGSGTYILSGDGQVSAGSEYIASTSGATGLFSQSGGVNSTGYMSIGAGGRYQLGGGTLQISGGLSCQGVLDGTGGAGSLTATDSIVDLSQATLSNLGSMSLSVGTNSLLVVSSAFNSSAFGHYDCQGIVHTAGSTLTMTADQSFGGIGSINDLVDCRGTITAAPDGAINLNKGLILSGSGAVALGGGTVTANDSISGVSGGTLTAATLAVGYNAGTGSYSLGGTGQLSVSVQYIGSAGTGSLTQSGGNNTATSLFVGYHGGSGTYNLLGGQLSAYGQTIGSSGTGSFTQSGGTNSVSNLEVDGYYYSSSAAGTYFLSGSGVLLAATESIAESGAGTLTQTGGTNSVGTLRLGGYSSAAKAAYNLSGSGVLSVGTVCIGKYSGTATFTQSGGINTANYVEIHSRYNLSGGSLNINGGLTNRGNDVNIPSGVFDLAGGAATVTCTASIVDFTGGAPQNAQNAALSIGPNSLLLVPTGYDPAAHWKSYSNAGMTHVQGSPLSISAGQTIYGTGAIADHVNCAAGTLSTSSGGSITLRLGLTLSGSGVINLGGGNLSVESGGSNSTSISGGSLTVGSLWAGHINYATVTQSGGTVSTNTLGLGDGWSGSAGSRSTGEYDLSGSGVLTSQTEVLGNGGDGIITQTGGTNTILSGLVLGRPNSAPGLSSSGNGIYNLNGGLLRLQSLTREDYGTFNFRGGTLQAIGSFSTSVPMMLSGTATVDTQNYGVAFSGSLSGPGGLTKVGEGTLTLSGDNSYTRVTTVQAGMLKLIGTNAASPVAWKPIFNGAGADVQGGKLVFDYATLGGASPATTIQSILTTSCGTTGASHFAASNGGKIYSSTAAAAGMALGWKDDATAVNVMYTFYGDTNLDGSVNLTDLGVLLDHFNTTGDVWAVGDFNYDGKVDLTDLGMLLDHYNSSLAGATLGAAALDSAAIRLLAAHGITVVPEPGMFALLIVGAIGLLIRARWNRR
jgi:hypothetical protein